MSIKVLRRIPPVWKFRRFCTKADDTPIKFSSSPAKSWKAEYSRKGAPGEDEAAWFQPISVTTSIFAFLVYFCVLREENDMDELIGHSLYDRIDGLEEAQLKSLLEYNLDNGKDTKAIVTRLRELEQAKHVTPA